VAEREKDCEKGPDGIVESELRRWEARTEHRTRAQMLWESFRSKRATPKLKLTVAIALGRQLEGRRDVVTS
jgi:hypothetical protein